LRRQASTNCPEGMKILLKNELSCVIWIRACFCKGLD
jgi:hypothetical protein